jgi:hypothetical protein
MVPRKRQPPGLKPKISLPSILAGLKTRSPGLKSGATPTDWLEAGRVAILFGCRLSLPKKENCRSLGSARDDKGRAATFRKVGDSDGRNIGAATRDDWRSLTAKVPQRLDAPIRRSRSLTTHFSHCGCTWPVYRAPLCRAACSTSCGGLQALHPRALLRAHFFEHRW